ncbi:sugar phosphate isomerase/epimerase family protein [Chitinophaga rhizophila]|uniref:Sugar phosphate isomerase/epimerase n=1 Tax=Chitinophaga rhizophila TaxID=2866212 RepID=A0ABS7G828_9BACT|nr:sugar phosphate isomerase/epimerase [Chitinophaga rhizophila]MBW8682877.1 sugar phosphate isomerase/epimerase [Chitinophaga rhizophila]
MHSRRTFIKQIGIASAGVLMLPSLSAMAGTAKVKKVGLQLYTLRDLLPKDVKGVIGQIAAAGYKEVETYGYNPQSGFWGLSPKEFKALLKQHKLSAVSGHVSIDSFIKGGSADDLKANIEALKTVDAEYLIVPWLGEDIRTSADDYKKIASKLNEAAEICKSSGLKFGYHNHDFEFKQYNDTTGYDILLKETSPKLVKFELDLYWVVRSGKKPVEMFEQHPGRFPLWHVKDMDKANPDQNTEVGNGSIDFKEIFAKASTAGMKHFFIEHENNYKPNEIGSIQESISYIQKNLLS